MAYWWSVSGQYYYTGDQADFSDIEVPERPTLTSIWVVDHWEDPGPTIAEQKATIIASLKAIDMLSIRPLREIAADSDDTAQSTVDDLDDQAQALIAQLAYLNSLPS